MQGNDITNYCVQELLKDGRTVTIRAIRPEDKGGLADALREISSESLYRRTFSARKVLSDHELRQLTEVDFDNIVALVAVMKDAEQDQIVGGGRYIRTDDAAATKAEVAFLIDDAHQGHGIGSRLLKHLVGIARASGITQFEAEVLPANESMLRVFTRSGVSVTRTMTRDSVHVLLELTKEEER
jgi:RimJ/RimL family protein N-acetyltransferase